MTTKRETILAAIKTVLDGVSDVEGVYRSRAQALRLEEVPAVLLEPEQVSYEYPNYSGGSLDSTMIFKVSVITRGDIPDQIADPIAADIYGLLMDDRQLGGEAMDLYLMRTEFLLMEGDGNVGVTRMSWAVKYRTAEGSMEA